MSLGKISAAAACRRQAGHHETAIPVGQNRASVLVLQTADAERYRALLEITAPTAQEYCRRHGFDYRSFIGIARGYHPWQACYNRIVLLRQLLGRGHRGWVFYLDADALIANLDFDLAGYLADKNEIAFIAATDHPDEPERDYWRINSGVFLINLEHPSARWIVDRWCDRFYAFSDELLREADEWGRLPHDQDILQEVLRDVPDGARCVLTVRGWPNLMNYLNGTFVRQVLRAATDSFDERVRLLRREAGNILGRAAAEPMEVPG